MLLNCGVGEDSWESLGLQGDPTSPFWRRSILGVLWKEWCWSWNSNTLTTCCEELTHLKRPWCWERLKAGGEGDNRGWDGGMASPTQWTWVWVNSSSWWWTLRPGVLWFMGSKSGSKSQPQLNDWTELNWTELNCYCSVIKLRPTFCYSVDGSVQGFYALRYLLEFAQVHVHWVGDVFWHLILCCPLILLLSIFPSNTVFFSELALRIRWPKYWSFSFSIGPSNEYSGLISFRLTGLISLLILCWLNTNQPELGD